MPQITSKPSLNPEMPQYQKKSITAESTGVEYTRSSEEPRQTDTLVETQDIPKEATLSPQLTALARKEQKIRQQEQQLKADREALIKEKESLGQLSESAIKERLTKGDFDVLDQLGVSYEKWTEYLINKGNSQDPSQQKIKALEDKLNTLESSQKQAVDKQYEATVAQYRRDITQTVESLPEFKGIKNLEAQEHVLEHILETFKEDGEVLTIKEACEDVQAILSEDAKRYAAAFKEVEKPETPKQEKVLPPPKTGLRTLTNQVTQATPSQPRNQFQHMSPKERIAQAMANAQKKTQSQ